MIYAIHRISLELLIMELFKTTIFVGRGKNFAGNIARFQIFQCFKKNLQAAVSYKRHADFERRTFCKIFHKLVVEAADRLVCDELRRKRLL